MIIVACTNSNNHHVKNSSSLLQCDRQQRKPTVRETEQLLYEWCQHVCPLARGLNICVIQTLWKGYCLSLWAPCQLVEKLWIHCGCLLTALLSLMRWLYLYASATALLGRRFIIFIKAQTPADLKRKTPQLSAWRNSTLGELLNYMSIARKNK